MDVWKELADLCQQKRYSEYVRALLEVASKSPGSHDSDFAKYELGIFYQTKEKNLEQAIYYFAEASNTSHQDILLLAKTSLGLCYFRKNDRSTAKEIFTEIVAKYPGTSAEQTAKNMLEMCG